MHLLKLCPHVKYLDLRSWDQNQWIPVDSTYEKCIEALGSVCSDVNLYRNLEGLRALRDYYKVAMHVPRQLKHLWLMYFANARLAEFISVISSLADSLETIQLYARKSADMTPVYPCEPLPCLPFLRHFGISVYTTCKSDNLPKDANDFCNFRSIFMVSFRHIKYQM